MAGNLKQRVGEMYGTGKKNPTLRRENIIVESRIIRTE